MTEVMVNALLGGQDSLAAGQGAKHNRLWCQSVIVRHSKYRVLMTAVRHGSTREFLDKVIHFIDGQLQRVSANDASRRRSDARATWH